jgi:60 kDa SS-A/Ro ribonucleoprotein
MVRNDAGGYGFKLSLWDYLRRILILGSPATYYVGQKSQVERHYATVLAAVKSDGPRAVAMVNRVIGDRLALDYTAPLFCLAVAISEGNTETRRAAAEEVTRLPNAAQLMHFASIVDTQRGWGKLLKGAVAGWYENRSLDELVYQGLKYQGRAGWTHKDLITLAHPNPGEDLDRSLVYRWLIGKDGGEVPVKAVEAGFLGWPARINAVERVKAGELAPDKVAALIREHRLTREMIPGQYMGEAVVWEALADDMPGWALLRNLGSLGAAGYLTPGDWTAITKVVEAIRDLPNRNVHPMHVFMALRGYEVGHSMFRDRMGHYRKTWEATHQVLDALSEVFTQLMTQTAQTNEEARLLVAIDGSGSMAGTNVMGVGLPLTALEAATAQALIMMSLFPKSVVVRFTYQDDVESLPIGPRTGFRAGYHTLMERTIPSGTDCSLPFHYAGEHNLDLDGVVVITDNETWHGGQHPVEALGDYRRHVGHAVKLAVVSTSATRSSIGDRKDPDTLEVVGFNAQASKLVSDFMAGKVG